MIFSFAFFSFYHTGQSCFLRRHLFDALMVQYLQQFKAELSLS